MSTKIRLLFICPGYGRISRGVEVFLHELVQRLDKNRFSITILGRVEADTEGIRCIKIPTIDRSNIRIGSNNPIFKLLRLIRLGSTAEVESLFFSLCSMRFLLDNDFDIILPFGGYWTYAVASLYKKKAKIVSIGHAGPVKCELKQSDMFVAITDVAYGQAKEIDPSREVVVIPNGVDTKKFSSACDQSGRPPTVLCVAAFSVDKRHDLLFDAMTLLDPSVRLVCVGSGRVPVSLSTHSLCKSHRVEFMSATHAEMPAIYRQADVFTLPSPEEAFGIVFLEAMASGLNVVAADAPRQRYVLGPAGFYCNVFDKEAYSKTLRKALSSPQQAINIARAAQFEWDRVAGLYQDLFNNMTK